MANKKRYYPLRSSTDPKKVKLVEITEEQYQAIYPEIWATIKREQRHGRCRCPANYLWTCNGYCSDCSYHTGGNEESIDELTETELSDEKPLMDELMACDQMLKLLVARFRELEPEADLIIEFFNNLNELSSTERAALSHCVRKYLGEDQILGSALAGFYKSLLP